MDATVRGLDLRQAGHCPALNGLVGGTGALYVHSGDVLEAAVEQACVRCHHRGELRADIEPLGLLRKAD
ncbi:TetR family transcriptional regulator [Gluconobacter japonicus]|nr:TetR family transcriptional regulator [Gluconobacter japonicus]